MTDEAKEKIQKYIDEWFYPTGTYTCTRENIECISRAIACYIFPFSRDDAFICKATEFAVERISARPPKII